MNWTVGNKAKHATHNPNMIYDENGNTVAQVFAVALHTTLEEEQKSERGRKGLAIAHLIASAPDLLAVLKAAYGVLVELHIERDLVATISAAIAKAENRAIIQGAGGEK